MDEKRLNEVLECSVCLELMDGTSRVLPCQHTFCRGCLDDIVASGRALRCPECRALVSCAVGDLPRNILLVRLLEGKRASAAAATGEAPPIRRPRLVLPEQTPAQRIPTIQQLTETAGPSGTIQRPSSSPSPVSQLSPTRLIRQVSAIDVFRLLPGETSMAQSDVPELRTSAPPPQPVAGPSTAGQSMDAAPIPDDILVQIEEFKQRTTELLARLAANSCHTRQLRKVLELLGRLRSHTPEICFNIRRALNYFETLVAEEQQATTHFQPLPVPVRLPDPVPAVSLQHLPVTCEPVQLPAAVHRPIVSVSPVPQQSEPVASNPTMSGAGDHAPGLSTSAQPPAERLPSNQLSGDGTLQLSLPPEQMSFIHWFQQNQFTIQVQDPPYSTSGSTILVPALLHAAPIVPIAPPQLPPGDAVMLRPDFDVGPTEPAFQNQERRLARALYTFRSPLPSDLEFKKGAVIIINREIDSNWMSGERAGKTGAFPSSYVQMLAPLPVNAPLCRALCSSSNNDKGPIGDRLKFAAGDVITIVRPVDKNWVVGIFNESIGILPKSSVVLDCVALAFLSHFESTPPTPTAPAAAPTTSTETDPIVIVLD